MQAAQEAVETSIPGRLDALPWGRFHTLIAVALGITWVIDGLEVTLAGSMAGALEASPSLHFSATDIGLASSYYLVGGVIGALFFGWLTDRLGRRPLFFITLGLYLLSTAATAFSWNLASFCTFRLLTGAGIGGEYSAINSAIQELIPARYRGWTDLAINGSFWIGAALGAGGSIFFLDPTRFAPDTGWRLAFFIGALIGVIIFVLRAWIPESPRWLVFHGKVAAAEQIVTKIEAAFYQRGASLPKKETITPIHIHPRSHTPLKEVLSTLFLTFRTRTLLGLTLMGAQAFFYNAIFFTYALVLTNFYQVPSYHAGWYILPFAFGNILGPLALGPLFDSIGRRPMIIFTYTASGLLLAVAAWLFAHHWIDAFEQTLAWSVIFFFASAAAGAAYLTVSEIFPVEIRALAIAFFYATGTAVGGVVAPYVFGALIETGSRASVFGGYLFGASLMILAAGAEWIWGVPAERKPLESVATPLSAAQHSREP
ncbi:MAG: MFS transporter [Alphaproteobacteria bacterium]|nr:MFS transporter [Alphaproteobacteria bacterium]